MSKGVIFVSTDWISDVLADALGKLDCEIIRGPAATGPGFTVYDPADYARLFGRTDVIVASPITKIDRSVMQAAPRLRAIMSPVIGVESIDVDAATDLGIIVGHGATPENFLGMSEATVLFIAALAMQMPLKQRLLAENAPRPRELTARSVRGRTIGLIGMGRIARGVVDRLQGWESEILYFDPYVPQDKAPAGIKKVELDELLQRSDFVSMHVTVTDQTRAMIGERELRLMKPTAYLVNTARGPVVDEAALVEALSSGALAGAGLDVFDQEPPPPDNPLFGFDNVVLTAHLAGPTFESNTARVRNAFDNVQRVARGEPPLWIVPDLEA